MDEQCSLTEVKSTELDSLRQSIAQPLSYIPFMKIISSSTKQFKENKGKLGDFFAAEQSFGSSLNVVAVTYRYKLDALSRASNKTIESLIEAKGDIPFPNRQTYKDFIKKHDKDLLKKGVELLLYLVDHNLFTILFFKGKTENAAYSIINNSDNKQIINITTALVAPASLSYDWFEILIFPTGKFLEKLESDDSKLKFETINQPVLSNDEER